jgi:predicted deacylase
MSALPVELIRGRNEAAVIWVQAGIHGDEQEAVLALKRYCQAARAEPPPLSLKVLCPANPAAFAARSRCAPDDGLDLNRGFPGDRHGSPSQQAAVAIWAEIEGCQGVIDIHSSSELLIGAPHAIVQDGGAARHELARAAARASGLPIVWASRGAWLAGSLMHAAMAAGIPACLLDIGASRPWARRAPVADMLTRVLRVYASAGLVEDAPAGPVEDALAGPVEDALAGPAEHEITDPEWIVSPVPGWLIEVREPGSLVRPGDVLALIWAEDTGTDHPVHWPGPADGLVVTVGTRRDVTGGTPLASVAALPERA